jgi:hypothetical protein
MSEAVPLVPHMPSCHRQEQLCFVYLFKLDVHQQANVLYHVVWNLKTFCLSAIQCVEAERVLDSWNVYRGLILPLYCRSSTIRRHLGAFGGAIRHATQSSTHVSERHAPSGCLRWGRWYNGIWTLVCGLVRLAWPLLHGDPANYRSIC